MFYASTSKTSLAEEMAPPQLNLLFWRNLPLSEWTHRNLQAPYWRLYWNSNEGASIRSGRQIISLGPDRIVLIPPDTPFSSSLHCGVTHFHVHFLTSRTWKPARPQVIRLSSDERRGWEAFSLKAGQKDNRPNSLSWEVHSLTCGYLARLPEAGWEPFPDPGERIRSALQVIDNHIPASIPVEELAKGVGMNLNAFIRLFRQKVGLTPARYARQRRLENACQLLHHSRQSIEEIAINCGFCDRYHFTRAFTRSRGIPPAAFRHQIQER